MNELAEQLEPILNLYQKYQIYPMRNKGYFNNGQQKFACAFGIRFLDNSQKWINKSDSYKVGVMDGFDGATPIFTTKEYMNGYEQGKRDYEEISRVCVVADYRNLVVDINKGEAI